MADLGEGGALFWVKEERITERREKPAGQAKYPPPPPPPLAQGLEQLWTCSLLFSQARL